MKNADYGDGLPICDMTDEAEPIENGSGRDKNGRYINMRILNDFGKKTREKWADIISMQKPQ